MSPLFSRRMSQRFPPSDSTSQSRPDLSYDLPGALYVNPAAPGGHVEIYMLGRDYTPVLDVRIPESRMNDRVWDAIERLADVLREPPLRLL